MRCFRWKTFPIQSIYHLHRTSQTYISRGNSYCFYGLTRSTLSTSRFPYSSAPVNPNSSFLLDKKLERGNLQHQKRTRSKGNVAQRKPAQSHSGSASQQIASSSSPSKPVLQRMLRAKNTIVALHEADTTIVSLDLSLTWTHSDGSEQTITKGMARDAQEAAVKTLERIRMLLQPPKNGSPKQGKGVRLSREQILDSCPPLRVVGEPQNSECAENPSAVREADCVELDGQLPNSTFWRIARFVYIGDNPATPIAVRYNVPTVTSVVPPSKPFVGLPLCVSVTALFAVGDTILYEWCTTKDAADQGEREVRSEESFYIPTTADLGKPIVLRLCAKGSDLWTQVQLPAVEALPPPVTRWEATTAPLSSPDFRAVTYNILYDDFCTSKSSRTKIYPFAKMEVLDLENRKVRLLQEMLAYNADLICLQECGRDLFQSYLLPCMKVMGYDGAYMNKSGQVKEGCGYLFRTLRFELVRQDSMPLNWASLQSQHPDLADRMEPCVELKEALGAVTSIGAFVVLRDTATRKEFVVGNTHLFYHANACHIRIMQAYMLLHWLHRAAMQDVEASGGECRPIVLCGDCNCTHSTGAYRLFTTGQVEEEHRSWKKGELFWWGCERLLGYNADQLDELMGNGEEKLNENKESETERKETAQRPPEKVVEHVFREHLHAPVRLTDVYERTDPSMPWTNYTLSFREVIDYIFVSEKSIAILRSIPIPPEKELSEEYALPNKNYPSDHVALIADLQFKW